MENLETIEYKGFNIKIDFDENTESPREWDNFGKMICWHNRYTLGDKKQLDQYSEKKECKLSKLTDACNGWDEVEQVLRDEFEAVVILPLFLYDHSGISMRTYPHGQYAGWDGGYIGFIYATKADILKKFNLKKLSKKAIVRTKEILEGEVETYNSYLTGQIFCYTVEDQAGNNHDSCGGFYEDVEALTEAKGVVDYIVKDKKQLQLQY